jgi:predicted phosphodiesterase
MKLAWLTDIHLNFLHENGSKIFGEMINEEIECDSCVITGDIAEGNSLQFCLTEFKLGFKKPVYFVLGNHDFYNRSFKEVETMVKKHLHDPQKGLFWLRISNPIKLNDKSCLVGSCGFYDGIAGSAGLSNVGMMDWDVIKDFCGKKRKDLLGSIKTVAHNLAVKAEINLEKACNAGYDNILFATHYPPFEKSCWHMGKQSDEDWLPWFTSVSMGGILAKIALKYPEKKFTVICGHTHSEGFYQHFENLVVYTGKAVYYKPNVNMVLEFK